MKAFDIERLLLLALVALAPIACGTQSPTGPGRADVTVTAMRAEPLPPPAPAPDGDRSSQCVVAAAEILVHRGNLPQPLLRDPVLLELLMLGTDGKPVSAICGGITWVPGGERPGSGFAAGAIITVSANTRFATVDGSAGSYVIVARPPHGPAASIVITLQ